jgi:hypothetical protein
MTTTTTVEVTAAAKLAYAIDYAERKIAAAYDLKAKAAAQCAKDYLSSFEVERLITNDAKATAWEHYLLWLKQEGDAAAVLANAAHVIMREVIQMSINNSTSQAHNMMMAARLEAFRDIADRTMTQLA